MDMERACSVNLPHPRQGPNGVLWTRRALADPGTPVEARPQLAALVHRGVCALEAYASRAAHLRGAPKESNLHVQPQRTGAGVHDRGEVSVPGAQGGALGPSLPSAQF